ncbi:hypothetical protein BJF79_41300 [Actinomadura sp. CNU-125]|uniref:hypothetical protein n=1 Tax=Actinomadura sp. CNU-125 TaxID=1904961 RepID=UPI0009694E8C|nr:hypothetical protein [Actinomadura sp. CNU-125]OLT28888.1 hypothetical protein BJF79_41300 [Actinomadura sp. CNU-125]
MSGRVSDHPLIKLLLSFGFPRDDYVVHGSGPLLVRGLRTVDELDIVARGAAWRAAARLGRPVSGDVTGARMYELPGECIHVSRHWFLPPADTDAGVDALIDDAEIFEGIRFARLDDVRAYKRRLGRAKDLADIRLLDRHTPEPGPGASAATPTTEALPELDPLPGEEVMTYVVAGCR